MDIEVTKLNLVEKGNFKGFADVQVGQIEIRGFRIIQQPGQSAWVSVPQSEYTKDDEKRYYNIVVMPDDLKRDVEFAVLEAWRERVGNGREE